MRTNALKRSALRHAGDAHANRLSQSDTPATAHEVANSGIGWDPESGARLRDRRRAKGMRLKDIAARSQLSIAYLSRLENGTRQPSISALLKLSATLGTTAAQLLPDTVANTGAFEVRRPRASGALGLQYKIIADLGDGLPTVLHVSIPGLRVSSREQSHAGHEWLHVLIGRVIVRVAGEAVELHVGDTFDFDGMKPHRLVNPATEACTLILVADAGHTINISLNS